MARAREVELDCEAPFSVAAAQVVEVRAEEVFEQAHGILDLDDPERVHDMRVATRRLRAALEIFAPCFPRKPRRKGLRRVKALADALGECRDVDVEIELLEGVAAELAGADREAVARLLAGMRGEQRRANGDLEAFVTNKRLKRLRRRLRKLAGSAGR
ncbi:MAG TPA: CHAD domain-containing protein [Solirubrobacterales bacterium]|nr:CHAD domain-containing protein [Solirubrobacterales bacterium]